jgi:hypothetical protein
MGEVADLRVCHGLSAENAIGTQKKGRLYRIFGQKSQKIRGWSG